MEKTIRFFSMSKNPLLSANGSREFHAIRAALDEYKPEKGFFLQLQFAGFFRFMAANLSLTHLVTAAKPR